MPPARYVHEVPSPPLSSEFCSSSEAEGNADDVLDLSGRDAEVRGDVSAAVAGLEAVDEILDPCAAVDDERLPERLPERLRWIDDDFSVRVGREPELLGPSVCTVGDAAEVLADDPP